MKDGQMLLDGSDSASFTPDISKKLLVCPFCSIARKEITASEVFRDQTSVAFLDKRPVFLGHCLLIPVQHFETFLDLPQNLISPLFANAQLIAKGVLKAMNADGILILINNKISQNVPHLHIHIIPRKSGDQLRGFMWPRKKYGSEEAMKKTTQAIISELRQISQNSTETSPI